MFAKISTKLGQLGSILGTTFFHFENEIPLAARKPNFNTLWCGQSTPQISDTYFPPPRPSVVLDPTKPHHILPLLRTLEL